MSSPTHRPVLSCPEELEKIFKQVEDESERRALQAQEVSSTTTTSTNAEDIQQTKSRRRGSVSITRFGQLSDGLTDSSPPTPNRLSTIAAKSSIYHSALNNRSDSSLHSTGSLHDHDQHDEHHFTQVLQIPPRKGSISRAVGGLIRNGRSRSGSVLSTNGDTGAMVITVMEATVEHEHETTEPGHPTATVSSSGKHLRNRASRLSIINVVKGNGLVSKAKSISQKFRPKGSKSVAESRKGTASNPTSSVGNSPA